MPAPPRRRMQAPHVLASTTREDARECARRFPASARPRRCRAGRPASRTERGSSGTGRRSRSRRTNRCDTMASKNSSANGSDRASAWIGNTPSSTPASRMRWWFSEALNHRSVAHTCTPNSRCRKIDDAARPQPRSSTRMPGRRSQRGREPLGQPERVRPAADAGDDPVRVVLATRAGNARRRTDCLSHGTLRPS